MTSRAGSRSGRAAFLVLLKNSLSGGTSWSPASVPGDPALCEVATGGHPISHTGHRPRLPGAWTLQPLPSNPLQPYLPFQKQWTWGDQADRIRSDTPPVEVGREEGTCARVLLSWVWAQNLDLTFLGCVTSGQSLHGSSSLKQESLECHLPVVL